MRFPLADLIDRHPRLQRAREVLSFAGARARDVQMGRAAGSLTFTTLLSMVPLFAVALALFTAFPLFAQFRDELEYFLLKVLPGQISSTVLRYVNEFAAQATRLTALGLAFLTVTALTMIITVDRVLNDIWRVRDHRPLAQRVLIYWTIVSLGPVLSGASLSASSYLWSLSSDGPALRLNAQPLTSCGPLSSTELTLLAYRLNEGGSLIGVTVTVTVA